MWTPALGRFGGEMGKTGYYILVIVLVCLFVIYKVFSNKKKKNNEQLKEPNVVSLQFQLLL